MDSELLIANLDHTSNQMVEDQLVSYSSLILLPFFFSKGSLEKQAENKTGNLIFYNYIERIIANLQMIVLFLFIHSGNFH